MFALIGLCKPLCRKRPLRERNFVSMLNEATSHLLPQAPFFAGLHLGRRPELPVKAIK